MATEDVTVGGDENNSMVELQGPQVEETTTSVTVAHAIQLRKDVSVEVKRREEGGQVRNQIVEALVDAEIKTRVEKLTKAFTKRNHLSSELDKIRPDLTTYNESGGKVTEFFSKDQMEKRKKAKEELAKLDKAIGKAVDSADYGDLQKFIGG